MKQEELPINPCINCITYAICKSQYIDKYNQLKSDNIIKHDGMKEDEAQGITYVKPVIAAYNRTLLIKCSIIQKYLSALHKTNDYISAPKTNMLRDTFINPKF